MKIILTANDLIDYKSNPMNLWEYKVTVQMVNLASEIVTVATGIEIKLKKPTNDEH